jgi:hypothetical protein
MLYIIDNNYSVHKILISTTSPIHPSSVFSVDSKTINGVKKYVVDPEADITLILPPQEKVVFPGTEEEQKTFRVLSAEIEKDRDEYRSRAWRAEEELKKAKQVIDDLKERKSND